LYLEGSRFEFRPEHRNTFFSLPPSHTLSDTDPALNQSIDNRSFLLAVTSKVFLLFTIKVRLTELKKCFWFILTSTAGSHTARYLSSCILGKVRPITGLEGLEGE
jgi:hypothetical protein